MRIRTLTGTAIVCLGMLGATAAMADNAAATGAGTGTWGATTCGDFTKMDATAQANLVIQIGQTDTSLTSNSGATAKAGAASTTPSTPVTAGQLVAACQAATPASTLQDAISKSPAK